MSNIVVAALYKFVTLPDYQELREPLYNHLVAHQVCGTLLLAEEGINGTIAGSRAGIDAVLAYLHADPRLADLAHKESYVDEQPFLRTKVKLKQEIVTMGVPGTDPNHIVGTHVDVDQWNQLIEDPNTVVIDTRNQYEVDIGTFKNAVSPETDTFRDFPAWAAANLDPERDQSVAMFCTGGIRCEKSTSYLKSQGFKNVYHLNGGILKYLENVPTEENRWEGDCFVFDGRVAVDKDLNESEYEQCYACRHPITPAEMQSAKYQKGVSCPYCFDTLDDERKARFSERQKQIELAQARGEHHIAADVDANRQRKQRERQALLDQQLNRHKPESS